MKKFLYLLTAIMLIGCAPAERRPKFPSEEIIDSDYVEPVIQEEEETSDTVDLTKSFREAVHADGRDKTSAVVKFEYDGHSYIWFAKSRRQNDRGYGFAGVVHDPDCKCNH